MGDPADARLEVLADGSIGFFDGTGAGCRFEHLPESEPVRDAVDGWTLLRLERHFAVRKKGGLTWYFPLQRGDWREILVDAIVDACRNSLHFIRGPEGLAQVVESAGRRLDVTSKGGLVERIALHHPDFPEQRTLARYAYDENGSLTHVYDALDNPYTFGWHADGRLAQHTNRTGLTFYYEYDAAGRCVHAWGDGGLYDYHFQFDPAGLWTNYTDSLGQRWSVEMDELGQIVRETDPLGGVTSYTYDPAGRTTSVTDPAGRTTAYGYDERGNLITLTRPDGKAIVTEFNAADKAVRITDPNGATWGQEWDSRDLLTMQVTPLGAESHYHYDTQGQLVAFVNPRGARTGLAFDAVGNLTRLTDALNHATHFAYDALGNITAKSDPLRQQTQYAYDLKGRLTRTVLPSGASIACDYDPEDNLTQYTDENRARTRLEYFGLGEIQRRIQPDGHKVEYHYDSEERLVGVTNQRGETYHLGRDALGRIVEEVDYWGQARRYAYDASGHLTSSTDPLGRTIRYATDPLGRILKKTLPDGFVETFAYDANGNLVETANAHAAIKRQFDAEGRLTEESQGAFSIKNSYDATGNRVARETSLGNAVAYEFDALDQAVALRINQDEPIRIERDAAGRIAREQLSPHLSRQFGYSADGYLTEQAVSANGSPIFATRFEYDAAGNLTQRSDSQYGVDVYRYDPLGRITEHLDPQRRITRYLNDPAGDRLRTRIVEGTRQRIVGGGVVEGEWSREGEYEGTYYRFDRAGNLAERRDGERDLRLVWDANQRLIESYGNGTVTRYGYDPLGRRLFKETGENRSLFYWDGDALVGESVVALNRPKEPMPAVAGNVVAIAERRENAQAAVPQKAREYVYYPETFEPLALVEGAGTVRHVYHYHNDPNGCPTGLTDAGGEVKWGAIYTAWGKISKLHANGVENPIRLQGQYSDAETGLHYNRYRFDDPVLGCFVSQDPLRMMVGPNLYWYAGSRFFLADPVGLSCTVDANANRWRNRQTGRFQAAPTDISDLVHNGRIDYNDVQAFAAHHGLPNNWVPSANFPAGGFRHQTTTATHNMSIHGHGVNPNAVANFPGSNAATGPTASIRRQPIGGGPAENFRTSGTWGSFGSDPNGAHIPMDNSPY
ncbi:MAG: RHS repeat protein [Thiocapsa sp.]|uniref:RHS repeat-associated core domain-containing protein n=1 Tax=Thiocapsa sp. TaxID=2024551 RepID=UPI001BCAD118|nr:RHS repeat-associated core domain-containing protein [Thiocapsa sp.]QVL49150.1 MAG: RHS repeat protein [Thiocapsa sp.]